MQAKTIKIAGEDRPFLISYRAAKELAVSQVNDPELETRNGGIDFQELLIFLGFKYGAMSQKMEFSYSIDDVIGWIEEDINSFPELVSTALEMTSSATEAMGKLKGTKQSPKAD